MTEREFEKLVADGIDALREDIRRQMNNVAIVIEDEPSEEQRQENGLADNETLFGLYHGVPLTERGIHGPYMPDKITIFKNPILEAYSDPADIAECVKNTVWHEVAHHFGMSEEHVRHEEHKRGRQH